MASYIKLIGLEKRNLQVPGIGSLTVYDGQKLNDGKIHKAIKRYFPSLVRDVLNEEPVEEVEVEDIEQDETVVLTDADADLAGEPRPDNPNAEATKLQAEETETEEVPEDETEDGSDILVCLKEDCNGELEETKYRNKPVYKCKECGERFKPEEIKASV